MNESGAADQEGRPIVAGQAQRSSTLLPLAAIGLLALGLRLVGLGRASLWFDEAISYFSAGLPAVQIANNTAQSSHPPLFYLVLASWRAAGATTDAGLRAGPWSGTWL